MTKDNILERLRKEKHEQAANHFIVLRQGLVQSLIDEIERLRKIVNEEKK